MPLCVDCVTTLTGERHVRVRDALNGLALTDRFRYAQLCGRCGAVSGGTLAIIDFET